MSIFARPISQLIAGDLQELLQENAIENVRLEFKVEIPTKDETLKKLSSFANTFGGFMVIGARANSADGRIQGLPGVEPQSNYKQTIIQWCFEGGSPPLTAEVSDPIAVPSGNGNVCYVIFVPESDVAPHFINGRKGVYVRTDEFSSRFEARLANETELRLLLDRRKLILERRTFILDRARRRFDRYMESRAQENPDAFLDFSVVPRFPSRPLVDQTQLASVMRQNYMHWRGVGFPKQTSAIISQQESAIVLEAARGNSLFEANVWGMLFYSRNITMRNEGNPGEGVHLYAFVGHILLFIRHAEKMLTSFGYSGTVHVETRLTSILRVPWLSADAFGGLTDEREGSRLDDEIKFSLTQGSDAFREKPDRIACEILKYILYSVDASDLIDTTPVLERLIRAGYSYNGWQVPTTLQI